MIPIRGSVPEATLHRMLSGSKNHEPPRNTRWVPEDDPLGIPSGTD